MAIEQFHLNTWTELCCGFLQGRGDLRHHGCPIHQQHPWPLRAGGRCVGNGTEAGAMVGFAMHFEPACPKHYSGIAWQLQAFTCFFSAAHWLESIGLDAKWDDRQLRSGSWLAAA
jgi:hypothetical protein